MRLRKRRMSSTHWQDVSFGVCPAPREWNIDADKLANEALKTADSTGVSQ
jgi:hypothetical protein